MGEVTNNIAMSITLTAMERAEIAALAGKLADTPPQALDDPKWMSAARSTSADLPSRVREIVREYRHDPGPDGLLLIRNLPVEESALRPTPTVPESVERVATAAAAVQVLIAQELGEVCAYRAEKTGALVQNVVPVPGQEDMQGNAGSVMLEMHVENAFHELRPDYISLLCLRNDHDNKAALRTACIRRALRLVPDSSRELLHEPRYHTDAPASFGGRANGGSPHPVLNGDREDPNVRVDFVSTQPDDEEAARAMADLSRAVADVTIAVVLQPGTLVFADNRLALHGRTAFRPRYDGRDRWLHRVFVQMDGRRSRVSREANGHVLT